MNVDKEFDAGIVEIEKMVYNHQLSNIVSYCENLVNNVLPRQREYKNQTGNTITSYSYGIFHNGKNVYIGSNEMNDPVRRKLKKGESWTGTNYDGIDTDLYGTIDTDGAYGEDTARAFIKSYVPKSVGFSVVICTGTEYSSFLENIKHLNVLSDSFETVSSNFINSFKPMK